MTKKLFGTDGVRGVANVYPMTAEFAVNWEWPAGRKFAATSGGQRSGEIPAFPVKCLKPG